MMSPQHAHRVVVQTPDDAEHLAAGYMQWLGLDDARVTPRGADGGIDVRSSRAIAQVKYRSNITGRPDLQRLFGARGHASHLDLFFFAYVGYSGQALQYAGDVGMLLFEYDVTGAVAPVNDLARRAHLGAVARDRAHRPVTSTAAQILRRGGPWGGVEIAVITGALTFAVLAVLFALIGFATDDADAFVVMFVAGILAAACFVGLVRSRRPKKLRRQKPASSVVSSPPVVVAPRRASGVACEYDHETRAVRRILVSTTGGTVVFARSDGGHSTSLEGFSGFADPEEVREARARARAELAHLGQTSWL
ncbi:restriction endonuclease [Cellulosimicrobium sp. Marseille-Q8652]